MIVLCQSVQSLAVGGIALFLPLVRRDLHLSFGQAGSLAAAATVAYAAMQLPAGVLTDRLGAKRLFLVGLFGTAALAFSFGTIHTFGWLIANQIVSGVFRSLMFAPGMKLI